MTLRSDLEGKGHLFPMVDYVGIYIRKFILLGQTVVKYYDLSAFALFLLNLKVKIKAFTKSLEHDNNNNSWY